MVLWCCCISIVAGCLYYGFDDVFDAMIVCVLQVLDCEFRPPFLDCASAIYIVLIRVWKQTEFLGSWMIKMLLFLNLGIGWRRDALAMSCLPQMRRV